MSLEDMVRESKDILNSLNIPYDNEIDVVWKKTRRKCFGEIIFYDNGDKIIWINDKLKEVSKESAMSTILHELLHSVDGCFKHTQKWNALVKMVNDTYPQFKIKRTNTPKEKGLKDFYRYNVICPKCGTIGQFERLSKSYRNIHRYICLHCGSDNLKIFDTKMNKQVERGDNK